MLNNTTTNNGSIIAKTVYCLENVINRKIFPKV